MHRNYIIDSGRISRLPQPHINWVHLTVRKFTWKLRPVIDNFEFRITNLTLPNELVITL
jgi:hypothetical protein